MVRRSDSRKLGTNSSQQPQLKPTPKSSQPCWKRSLLLSKSENEPCPCDKIHLAFESAPPRLDHPTQIIKSDARAVASFTKSGPKHSLRISARAGLIVVNQRSESEIEVNTYWMLLAAAENTLLALVPISLTVPITSTKITASITAYSAIS